MSTNMIGILRMPDELYWMDDFMTRRQHNANRFAAADEIERLQAELEETRKAAAEEYEEMSKLLAGFERDAMRYQWLRQRQAMKLSAFNSIGRELDRVVDLEMERDGK